MPEQVSLVVDVANVMGSRPDGWWRDRLGAATRWLAALDRLAGREVRLPGGSVGVLAEVVAVVEGQARRAAAPEGAVVRVVRAERDGDSAIVDVAGERLAAVDPVDGGVDTVLVVTADRGLRDRLPPGVGVTGPGWLLELTG
ncbi:MAG TPA: hypothetical protein VFP72_23815 [Kineosporiaceae bacterium]|nr:hypothetical protein [Kineosporiaceae bacterium]